MRRTLSTLATAAGAATLALGLAGSASAAEGQVIFNTEPLPDASGCIDVPTGGALQNETSEFILLFEGPGCQGQPAHAMPPGTITPVVPDSSIYVP